MVVRRRIEDVRRRERPKGITLCIHMEVIHQRTGTRTGTYRKHRQQLGNTSQNSHKLLKLKLGKWQQRKSAPKNVTESGLHPPTRCALKGPRIGKGEDDL